MIWREPRGYHADCYFCNTITTGFSVKNKHKIIYPNLDSARRPIPHLDTLSIPFPPQDRLDSFADEMETEEGSVGGDQLQSIDHDYTVEEILEPKTFTQDELNDLVRDLALSKEKAELASRLKEKHLLDKNVLICHYHSLNFQLATFFKVDGPLCYCHDIIGLLTNLSQIHIASICSLILHIEV